MSAKANSTIGFEKRNNAALNLHWEGFQKQFKTDFPVRPKSFSHIIKTNINGPPLLERCPMVRDLSPAQMLEYTKEGATVLDIRDTAAFGGVHIPGSINIGLANQTANWIGMVIQPNADLILLVADEQAYDEMSTQLHRIGYDNIIGCLNGGIAAWQEMGYPIDHLSRISTDELRRKLQLKQLDHLIDVRTENEWREGHIEETSHLTLTIF
jgi:hydroxyacylglutathione hydrolase